MQWSGESRGPASHSAYMVEIAKGAGVVFLGTAVGSVLGYVFQLMVAQGLGTELFGLFSLGAAIFNVVAIVALVGMGQAVMRYVALYRGSGDPQRIKGTVGLALAVSVAAGVAVGLLLLVLAPGLAERVFHASALSPVVRALALAIPLNSVTVVLLAATQGLRIMTYRVWVKQVAEVLWRIGLVLLLFFLGWRLAGAVAAYATSLAVGSLMSLFFYRRAFRPVLSPGIRAVVEPRPLLAFAWPLCVSQGLYTLQTWIPVLALGHLTSAEEVGVFGAAYRTGLLVQSILMSFNPIFAPIIADLLRRGENRRVANLFKAVARWILSLCLPVLLILALFSREILGLFGAGFGRGSVLLVVLCAGQLVNCGTGPLGVVINMSGRSRLSLLNTVFYLALQLVLCLWLIPRLGILGAALSAAVSIAALCIVQLIEVFVTLKVHPFSAAFLKPLGAGAAACLAALVLRVPFLAVGNPLFRLVLGGAVLVAIYIAGLAILGFDADDRLVLARVRSRLAF